MYRRHMKTGSGVVWRFAGHECKMPGWWADIFCVRVGDIFKCDCGLEHMAKTAAGDRIWSLTHDGLDIKTEPKDKV